jgi:uncharacterized membrane protein
MSVLILAAMLGLTAWVWQQIPDGTSIAIHWGLDNRPNGFASKPFALLIAPGMALALALLFAFVLPVLMGRESFSQNATVFETGWIGALVILAVVQVLIVMTATGYKPDIGSDVTFSVGLLLAVIGNFLGKTRPNPFVGLRTFWTLRSDHSWEKSNRALGRMFVATGIATLVAMAAAGWQVGTVLLIVGSLGSGIVCVALSYIYWKNDPERVDVG